MSEWAITCFLRLIISAYVAVGSGAFLSAALSELCVSLHASCRWVISFMRLISSRPELFNRSTCTATTVWLMQKCSDTWIWSSNFSIETYYEINTYQPSTFNSSTEVHFQGAQNPFFTASTSPRKAGRGAWQNLDIRFLIENAKFIIPINVRESNVIAILHNQIVLFACLHLAFPYFSNEVF